jgi:hypothetical protein
VTICNRDRALCSSALDTGTAPKFPLAGGDV